MLEITINSKDLKTCGAEEQSEVQCWQQTFHRQTMSSDSRMTPAMTATMMIQIGIPSLLCTSMSGTATSKSYTHPPRKLSLTPGHNFYQHNVYVSAVFATATWLAGWLDVTRQYCINTAKPILKLFWPSGSTIILIIWPDTRYPIRRVTPSAGAINTRGWEKLAIFAWNHYI